MPRSRTNYFYAIFSVALVLFALGFFALSLIQARKLIAAFKENVDIWLELRSGIPQSEVSRIIDWVNHQPAVKAGSVSFISQEEAAQSILEDLGDESLLEDMPELMRDVVRFHVHANYFDEVALQNFRSELRRDSAVADLHYEVVNIGNVSQNMENLGFVALGIGILLIFASVALIHNTIRLALYANRFTIKHQELVGASWKFISRPFLIRGILNGLWSALLAISGLIALWFWIQNQLPDVETLEDPWLTASIFVGMALSGVLISGISTYMVVNKFLKMRIDDLY